MTTHSRTRLLIVGNPEPIHIGAHLLDAARDLGLKVELCDVRKAYAAAWVVRQVNWRMRGHRPAKLETFNHQVLEQVARFEPTHVLATGIAPLTAETLRTLRDRNLTTFNYLTDDPWNPNQRAEWFLRGVGLYGAVFTPRHANESDLRRAGCARVEYLPFGYNPKAHYPSSGEAEAELACDVVFAGGADADRVPYLAACIQAGLDVHLYGGYWERYAATRRSARGHAGMDLVRRAVRNARICLNLVRRSNRDDHVMRTFELAAMRGCILTEDTTEHRRLFGAEGEAVLYFATVQEMLDKAHRLLTQPAERERMAHAAHALVTGGKHTYQDRLATMLGAVISQRVDSNV